jgi:hypothetical protein
MNANQVFFLSGRSLVSFIPNGGTSAAAFGINDHGMIAGQKTTSANMTSGFAWNATIVSLSGRALAIGVPCLVSQGVDR